VTPRAGHEFRTNKLSLRLFSRQTADWFWMPYRKDPNSVRIILLIICC
jgi:hypothetical protein